MIRCGRGLRNETMILFCPKNVSCDWKKGSVDRCFFDKNNPSKPSQRTTHPDLPKGKELVTRKRIRDASVYSQKKYRPSFYS